MEHHGRRRQLNTEALPEHRPGLGLDLGNYIMAGYKITEDELMREKFIMGPGTAPTGEKRQKAVDNFLADVLADPDMAGALHDFLPHVLGLAPSDKPENRYIPNNILPWAQDAQTGRHIPANQLPQSGHYVAEAAAANQGLEPTETLPLKDFFGRSAALALGAAIVGAAALDRQYLYTHSLDGRKIEVGDQSDFYFQPDSINLPGSADRVLVLGFVRAPEIMGMNPGLAKLRPAPGWLSWPEQTTAVLAMADWLKARGYLALPSAGGLLMAGHHGVLAGLGELGRQGLLISPEYGPNLRLFTIVTDYPFSPGRPLIFGVANYCETCQRCITECPAKALTEGHRRPGLFQWPVNRRACFDNWLEKKDPCRKCIEVCPYTREPLVGSPGGAHRPPPA